LIQALTGTSLIEYPGRISSVIFIRGCNLYCPFCHNPELVLPSLLSSEYTLDVSSVISELIQRDGFIEAVSITGGEPLLFGGLEDLIDRIRSETKLLIKVDTNGTFPEKLGRIVDMVDFVAMDLKSSPSGYPAATGGKAVFESVEESIGIVRSMPTHEFRTTLVPGLVTADDVMDLLATIGPLKRYALQRFSSTKTLSPEYTNLPAYPKGYIEELANRLKDADLVEEIILRI